MPRRSPRSAGGGNAAAPSGASRTITTHASEPASVIAPTVQKAPRQPATAISAASGAEATRAPRTPTVAVTADSKPKRSAGNHAAAILRVPMNVTVAPRPTAAPIASVPSPITAPPAAGHAERLHEIARHDARRVAVEERDEEQRGRDRPHEPGRRRAHGS